jgi:hypothetical protein
VQNHTFALKQKILRAITVVFLAALGLTLLFGLDGMTVRGGRHLFLAFHVAGGLLLLAACYICYSLLETKEEIKPRLVFVAFAFFVVAVPLAVDAHWYHPWMRWDAVIDKDAYVRQEIRLPTHLVISDVVHANLQIDARYEPRFEKSIRVTVNGTIITPLLMPQSNLRTLMSKGYRPFLGKPNDVDLPPPDWKLLSIPKELLLGRYIDVTISFPENDAEGYAIVYGSLPENSKTSSYYGPRPYLDASILQQVNRPVHRESLWKYETTGDIRLFDSVRLSGDAKSVYVYKDGAGSVHEDTGDLSSHPLKQSGTYNIRLQLITADGKEIII